MDCVLFLDLESFVHIPNQLGLQEWQIHHLGSWHLCHGLYLAVCTAQSICAGLSSTPSHTVIFVQIDCPLHTTARPDHAVRQKAPDGHEPGMPVYTYSLPPPPVKINDAQMMQIIAESKEKYGIKPSDIEDELESEQTLGGTGRWRAISAQRLPYEMEWKIILHIWTGQYILQDITRGIDAMTRDDVSATLATLIDLGYVQKIPNPKTKHSPLYALTNMALDAYVNLDFYLIGRSAETPLVAQQAVDYYRKKGWFVCFAIQTGNLRPDLVAYDYSTGISVSVEIESNTEVKSHPEHVRFNMKKWQKLGFEECHVWSSSKTIEKMHKELDELHDKVRTFVVKLPDSVVKHNN